MFSKSRSSAAALAIVVCALSAPVNAQSDLVTTPPANLAVSNYNSTPVGPYGGLEGSAYVARIGDPSGAWFNPAGLAREATAQISGSAGVYQRTVVNPRDLESQGGSIQQLPNFVGFTFVPTAGITVGAALLNTNAWDQETDAELLTPVSTGQQRFAYSADSGFEQRVMAIGAGYKKTESLRVGGGFAFSLMDLRMVQTASDRIGDNSGLRSLMVSARTSGSALQLRAQGGVQYEYGIWRLGGALRTPGVTIHKTGSVILDGVLANIPGSSGASVFDPDATLEYHLPWEFQGGAALVRSRFELELDLQAYTPIDPYPLFSSDQPLRVYTGTGANVPPTVTSQPFTPMISASNGVVNVAAGGHVQPLRNRDLRVHAGVAANHSPAGPEDVIFNEIDLTVWSIGVSGTFGRFQFAAGMHHQSGNADDVRLRNLLNGQVVHSPVDVRLTGFVYSLAYRF